MVVMMVMMTSFRGLFLFFFAVVEIEKFAIKRRFVLFALLLDLTGQRGYFRCQRGVFGKICVVSVASRLGLL